MLICRSDRALPAGRRDPTQDLTLHQRAASDAVVEARKTVSTIYEVPHRAVGASGMDDDRRAGFSAFEALPQERPRSLGRRWWRGIGEAARRRLRTDREWWASTPSYVDSYKSVQEALHPRSGSPTNVKRGHATGSRRGAIRRGTSRWTSELEPATTGILVPGGFGIRAASPGMVDGHPMGPRERHVRYFGICLGLQCAVIEFARTRVRASAEADSFRVLRGRRRTRSSASCMDLATPGRPPRAAPCAWGPTRPPWQGGILGPR